MHPSNSSALKSGSETLLGEYELEDTVFCGVGMGVSIISTRERDGPVSAVVFHRLRPSIFLPCARNRDMAPSDVVFHGKGPGLSGNCTLPELQGLSSSDSLPEADAIEEIVSGSEYLQMSNIPIRDQVDPTQEILYSRERAVAYLAFIPETKTIRQHVLCPKHCSVAWLEMAISQKQKHWERQ